MKRQISPEAIRRFAEQQTRASFALEGRLVMAREARHGYTSHGYVCCDKGVDGEDHHPELCGGPLRCRVCKSDVAGLHSGLVAPAFKRGVEGMWDLSDSERAGLRAMRTAHMVERWDTETEPVTGSVVSIQYESFEEIVFRLSDSGMWRSTDHEYAVDWHAVLRKIRRGEGKPRILRWGQN